MTDLETNAYIIIVAAAIIGFIFALFLLSLVSAIEVDPKKRGGNIQDSYVQQSESLVQNDELEQVYKIYTDIQTGAKSFLAAEYSLCMIFIVVFGLIVMVLTAHVGDEFDWSTGGLTATSFAVGALTSIVSGYLGMMVAVYSNARTTLAAQSKDEAGWTGSFNTAFRAGGVMGYSLCSLALIMLFILFKVFEAVKYPDLSDKESAKKLFECLAGYGLGGSCIALFGRVGGGIYTKAADVGADLAGKVVENIPEDDPRNPATIADNVGDNVGDVAGMGSDLFGSFAEATCAALVISASSSELVAGGVGTLMFPLLISACGILVCLVTSFIATNISPVKEEKDVETVLKTQLAVSTGLMVAAMYPLSATFLPKDGFSFPGHDMTVTPVMAWGCVTCGLVGGCIIGFVTEYYTSHSYKPVQDVANACKTGAATNIIAGLALGYLSNIVPITIIAVNVYISFYMANMYGVALAALGMLGTLCTCLSIDVYGPVCDNAGGIAEMAQLHSSVRDKTDALDAAGNTTAAIGKGFAIGSAALVSLALFGGFVTRLTEHLDVKTVDINILRPITFAFLFIGAMLPYWFTAMTMKSVGVAAMKMVAEVARQFREIEGLLEGRPGAIPEHDKCIAISTNASLKEMVPPGLLVILSPILCGIFFGVEAVCGLLVGSLTSGVQLAISQSNTGGAWDNAKKYVERGCVKNDGGEVQGKGSEVHKAAVAGDTVGDPLKDTSGPALNILMKLQAIISLVFADFFMSINCGAGVLNVPSVMFGPEACSK